MKKSLKLLASIALGLSLALVPLNVSAWTLQEGADLVKTDEMPNSLFGDTGIIRNITNIALYVIAGIAVIMLLIGGLRYILSGGDSKKVTDAKNTVLYAIIGLVIAILSYAIINFIIGSLAGTSDATTETVSLLTQY